MCASVLMRCQVHTTVFPDGNGLGATWSTQVRTRLHSPCICFARHLLGLTCSVVCAVLQRLQDVGRAIGDVRTRSVHAFLQL